MSISRATHAGTTLSSSIILGTASRKHIIVHYTISGEDSHSSIVSVGSSIHQLPGFTCYTLFVTIRVGPALQRWRLQQHASCQSHI